LIDSQAKIASTQTILVNYDFKTGRKIILKSPNSLSNKLIVLSEDILKIDKLLYYEKVDFDGDKDEFKI